MKKNKKQFAIQAAAAALVVLLTIGAAQPLVAYAAEAELGGVQLLADDPQEQTRTKELYTVGNTAYENSGGTTKGNGHDCQHLDLWVPTGVTFKIRQTNKNLGQNLTLKMRNDDRLTEGAYTLKSDGSWLEITPTADSVPLISSVYSATGEKPVVEYTIDGTKELPIYHFGDNEIEFYKKWDELDAPFAVYLSEYTIWLVPARDKTQNSVGSLDDLLLWYDNMIRQYNAFSGLTKDAPEEWNRDSGTKYLIKANRHGWGAAYYSVAETAPNGDSLLGYMNTSNWGPLHEVGHGYDTLNFGSAEIWNNVLAHYYQVYALGAGRWLGLSDKDRAGYEEQRSTLDYFGTEDYHAKLYFWVNMLDKLGAQKTSAYAYQLYRGNKANGVANLGGHDFYVDAYTHGSGYNVSAWFDMWGFTVSDSVKQALIEEGAYQNIYPLRNLVKDDATAETIRTALGLVSKYSMMETQELQIYFKTAAPINGTLSIHLDDLAYEETKNQKICITDGVSTIREVDVTAKDMEIELPIGLYNIIVPTAKGEDLVILQNRVGYAAIAEEATVNFNVTAEKVTSSHDFVDWTIKFGSNYSYWGTFCTASTDIANGKMRITTVACSPHSYFYSNTFSSIRITDADGNEVYSKVCPGQETTAEAVTIDIQPGYIIEVYHAEPGRGHSVESSAMGSVKLVNNDQKTSTYKVTEYGLEMLTPTAKSGEENYYDVLCAYMDSLKDANAKADFQNPEKLPAEKVRVNAAVAKMAEEWQTKFKEKYAGYYPFDQGVREIVIAPIPAQDYTGAPVTPELDITVNGTKLTADDYRAEWTRNTDVGTASVKVYGLGSFEDCIGTASFEIKLPDGLPKSFTVECEYKSVSFSNGAKRPSATVRIGDKVLTRGVDYVLSYENNTNVGTATVIATGIGNYAGISGTDTFQITHKLIEMTVTANPAKLNYTGEAVTTDVTVLVGKLQLTQGKDYTVSYQNNVNVGTATILVTGIGNYEGSVGTSSFEITQPVIPAAPGGTIFSNWTYALYNYANPSDVFSRLNFDLETGTLTVYSKKIPPHYGFGSNTYASISVFDTEGSRSYYKNYIGNGPDASGTQTARLGLGYIVEIYVAEPPRGGTSVSADAVSTISMRPKTAKFVVTPYGLQEITADGSTGSGDMASQYDTVLRAYMDQLKKDNPQQEDFWDNAKFPDEKAEVEKGVKLLTEEQFAKFKEDYAGYYPFKAPTVFTVAYDWGTEFPDGETLPTNSNTYQTEEAALAAMDTTYTSSSISNAPKDGKDGIWTFSGWTATVEDAIVKFTGTWTFTEKETPVTPDPVEPKPPVRPSRPSASAKPAQKQEQTSKLPFSDVKTNAWYCDAVQYVYESGIMSGTSRDTFSPELETTRAMIVTMLYRAEKEPSVSGVNPFTDAQYGYYVNAVRWAQQEGIMTGTGSTEFRPDAPMTREQLAAVLYRYAKYLGRDTGRTASLDSFADGSSVSGYARETMAWAVAEGLITGVGGNRMAPTAPATRAQVAEILYRFLR